MLNVQIEFVALVNELIWAFYVWYTLLTGSDVRRQPGLVPDMDFCRTRNNLDIISRNVGAMFHVGYPQIVFIYQINYVHKCNLNI